MGGEIQPPQTNAPFESCFETLGSYALPLDKQHFSFCNAISTRLNSRKQMFWFQGFIYSRAPKSFTSSETFGPFSNYPE